MLAIRTIGGVQPAVQPLRDGYQVIKSDLVSDSSGRTVETGQALRYMIRPNTYKLNLKFKGTVAEIKQVEALVSQYSYEVEFFDGISGGSPVYITGHYFYPSDRTVNYNEFTGELSVNLIEI